ncbi:DUF3572 family protein [Sphingomicrobium astaxanthinifaciens]|uniref:DUF3572 family protein n=1 Tax=Sphingomicrobium astaxanthinifaciens TaxID=1227949 RepID=UPI001FCA9116|nr:DUF3572 family protein [Sphingomicrobium astaxanthinifaciens]MCJ7421105.1 DUF3572 domain-containing protein [Sphingomicrobium astaxanthinifaciens]
MPEKPNDPHILGLRALAATLGDQRRADRLLATTGLSAAALRAGATDPAMLAATLAFLEAHEPDLLEVAAELEVAPEELVRSRAFLER